MIEIIGYIAATLTTASLLPQAFKTIKTRDTSGISLITYLMIVVGVALWLVYGILLGNKILIIANAITLMPSTIILLIKIQNILKR